jgi:hypothetical protein
MSLVGVNSVSPGVPGFVALLVVFSLRISIHWSATEKLTFEEYTRAAAELKLLRSIAAGEGVFRRLLFYIRHALRFRKLNQIVRYHKLRLRFIASNSLEEDFRFA